LKLVDEERARGVHRPEADEAFANVEPPNELHDPVGEIDQFDPLIRVNDQRLAVNRKAADLRGGYLFHRPLANRDGRTLAHALLLSTSSSETHASRPWVFSPGHARRTNARPSHASLSGMLSVKMIGQ